MIAVRSNKAENKWKESNRKTKKQMDGLSRRKINLYLTSFSIYSSYNHPFWHALIVYSSTNYSQLKFLNKSYIQK
jgi:hypothetical protein